MLPVDTRATLPPAPPPPTRVQEVRLPQALRRQSARVFFDFAARNSAGAHQEKELRSTLIVDESACFLSAAK
jgi:hypothetical protein